MPQIALDTSRLQPPPLGSNERPLASGGAAIQRTLHRRRVLLAALLVAAVVSLVLALVTRQGAGWVVHALADGVLLTYVAVLIRFRNAAAENEMARRELGR